MIVNNNTKWIIASIVMVSLVVVVGIMKNSNANSLDEAELLPARSVEPASAPIPKLTGSNLIKNADLEAGNVDLPDNWNKNSWGDNTAVFTYPVAGVTGNGAKVEMTSYTDGDAKWYFDDVSILDNESYTFVSSYRSSVQVDLIVRYTMADGSYRYVTLETEEPSVGWKERLITIITPIDAKSLTVFHVLAGVGELTVDDYGLYQGNAFAYDRGKVTFSFDDGWMEHYEIAKPVLDANGIDGTFYIITKEMDKMGTGKRYYDEDENDEGRTESGRLYVTLEQVKEMRGSGHEIGSHTRTHPHLSRLNPKGKNGEIRGSLRDLLEAGFDQVSTIAYPYGDFDDSVKAVTAKTGYTAGRSVLRGFNDRSTNHYELKVKQIDRDTPVEDMMGWIDQAERDNLWLILMFHQISDDMEAGLGITEEDFITLTEYAVEADVDIVTVAEGVLMEK